MGHREQQLFIELTFNPPFPSRINHTVILEDPFDDPKGLTFPDRSPEPTKEQLEVGHHYNSKEILAKICLAVYSVQKK